MVAQAPVGLAMFDTQMRYLACSQQWKAMFGFHSDDDFMGRSHYEVFHDIPMRWRVVHQQVLQGQAKEVGVPHDGLRPGGSAEANAMDIGEGLGMRDQLGRLRAGTPEPGSP